MLWVISTLLEAIESHERGPQGGASPEVARAPACRGPRTMAAAEPRRAGCAVSIAFRARMEGTKGMGATNRDFVSWPQHLERSATTGRVVAPLARGRLVLGGSLLLIALLMGLGHATDAARSRGAP